MDTGPRRGRRWAANQLLVLQTAVHADGWVTHRCVYTPVLDKLKPPHILSPQLAASRFLVLSKCHSKTFKHLFWRKLWSNKWYIICFVAFFSARARQVGFFKMSKTNWTTAKSSFILGFSRCNYLVDWTELEFIIFQFFKLFDLPSWALSFIQPLAVSVRPVCWLQNKDSSSRPTKTNNVFQVTSSEVTSNHTLSNKQLQKFPSGSCWANLSFFL